MSDGSKAGSSVPPSLAWLWSTFWFLRGVLAAWLIISLVPQVAPNFSQWEALRALHALLQSWQQILTLIAQIMPPLAWFKLTAADVFALIFTLSIGLPAAYAAATIRERFRIKDEGESPKAVSERVLLDRAFALLVGLFVLLCSFVLGALVHGGGSGIIKVYPSFVQVLVVTLLFWVIAIFMLPGYFRGLVFVLGFIITIEGLYWLNTPSLKEWVDVQVEQSIGPDPLRMKK